MAMRYQLRDATGDDLGEAEYGFEPRPGDEIRVSGNRRALVTAVVPVERMEEHVARAVYGLLQIELLNET